MDELPYILVCGGRYFANRSLVYFTLDLYLFEHIDLCIVHGACTKGGADILAEDWAKARECMYIGVPALWKQNHKRAGPIRNRYMFDKWEPTHVVAFEGGRGTIDMCEYARSKGVTPHLVGWNYR